MSTLADIESVTRRMLVKYNLREIESIKKTYLRNLQAADALIFELSDNLGELCPDPTEIKKQKSDLKYACEVRGIILAKLRAVNARIDEIEISCMC